MCTKSLLHADFTRALCDRHQHDVHQSHTANAERKQSNKAEKNLDSCGDDLQVHQVSENVEDENRPLILGIEVVVKRHRLAHAFDHLGVIAFVLHDHRTQVVRVGQVAHRAVGNVDVFVDV